MKLTSLVGVLLIRVLVRAEDHVVAREVLDHELQLPGLDRLQSEVDELEVVLLRLLEELAVELPVVLGLAGSLAWILLLVRGGLP